MAVNYIFDTKYWASQPGGSETPYRIIIGDTGGVVDELEVNVAANKQLDLMDPGASLEWAGGQDRFTDAISGSTLSFTVNVNDVQLAKLEELFDRPEGYVFALFFDTHTGSAKPVWYGHLLVEGIAVQISNERHIIDLTFTDGLAYLRGVEWKDDNDDEPYAPVRKRLAFWIKEIALKIPAHHAFRDYVINTLGQTNVPIFREVGFPDPRHDDPNGSGSLEYDTEESKLWHGYVHADTFNKPKKQVDRTRELEVPLKYFDTGAVLEDIAHTFGATIILWEGFLNVVCRLDVATMKGERVQFISFSHNPSSDSWIQQTNYNNTPTQADSFKLSSDLLDEDFDEKFKIRNGAVKRRTLPIEQVNLTHEEGGSDWLYADGFYQHPNISYLDFDQVMWNMYTANGGNVLGQNTGQTSTLFQENSSGRRDKWYVFHNGGDPTDEFFYNGGAGVQLGDFYTFPADPTGYMGFPARTTTDLEVQSGALMTIDFGANIKLWKENGGTLSTTNPLEPVPAAYIKMGVGTTVIWRLRIQVKDTNGDYWRLRRHVTTHVNSGGSPDGINIDNIQVALDFVNVGGVWIPQFTNIDRTYFRKVYGSVDWVKSGTSGYNDAWYEIMGPHEDTNNSGDTWGAPTIPLTVQYGNQTNFCPMGTQIDGEDNGEGVILEEGEDNTFHNFTKEMLQITLPYETQGSNNQLLLDFEEFYIEMGVELWPPYYGPRINTGSFPSGSPVPYFRSANADGTGGSWVGAAQSYLEWRMLPKHVHFTGCRISIGDTSETSDFVTRINGGNGYETVNIGSSRLGSRYGFVNTHTNGIIEMSEIDSNGSPYPYNNGTKVQNLQWRAHKAGDTDSPDQPTEVYDSLHSYVCHAYMDIFGEHRSYYDLTAVATGDASSLISPFGVYETAFTQDNPNFLVFTTEFLMPMSMKWTANQGVSGSFLSCGFERDVNPLINEWVFPTPGDPTGGNGSTGNGGGGLGKGDNDPTEYVPGYPNPPGGKLDHGFNGWGTVQNIATKTHPIQIHPRSDNTQNGKTLWESIRYFHDADNKIDLFDFEDIETRIKRVTFDPLPSGDSIVIADSNGDLSHIVDGTSGQILQTDGSGGYSFVDNTASSTDTIQIASRSPQLNLTTGTSYYFGNTSTGWEGSYVRNQATITSISYAFANCGIVCPKPLTSLSFMANIRSVNRTDDLTVKVAKGGRPDGTTTAITLTELGSDTITVSQLYRFYKMDIDVTGITVKKGDLIFLFWYRDGVSVSAANYYTTWTLQGS
jgi:hypothetical protein